MSNKTILTFKKGSTIEPDELKGMICEHFLSMEEEDYFLTNNGLNER